MHREGRRKSAVRERHRAVGDAWTYAADESSAIRVDEERQLAGGALGDEGRMSMAPVGERMLAAGHRHGFISVVTADFAEHYPLALRPQRFWLMRARLSPRMST
jgi:hypothetical protein